MDLEKLPAKKDAITRYANRIAPFQQPLVTAASPDHFCGCSWVWRPGLTLDSDKPFCIKFRAGWCWRHKLEEAYGET